MNTLLTKTLVLVMIAFAITSCRHKPKIQHEPEAAQQTAPPDAPVYEMTTVDTGTATVKAVNFSWKDKSGHDASLVTTYKGKVLLVNFWATWCGPCNVEIPDFIKYQADYGSRGLQIVSVSIDTDPFATVTKFVAEKKLNYPVILDKDQKLSTAYNNIRVVPTTFLIDRDGTVKDVFLGQLEAKDFNEKVKPLLTAVAAK